MPKMKQSRKMYGCKLCKTLYTELHKVSSNNSRTTNTSIELHVERNHPGVLLSTAIDHISKFSKVSEARAALAAEGYDALLGPRAKSENSVIASETSDDLDNVTPVRSTVRPAESVTTKTLDPIGRKSLIVVLKVSAPLLLKPPASTTKASEPSSFNQSSSPLPVAEKSSKIVPNKLKLKQISKTKKTQDWLKTLDRSGKPCRRWQRKTFEVTSFTKYTFGLTAWQKDEAVVAPQSEELEEVAVSSPAGRPTSSDASHDSQKQEIEYRNTLVQQENALQNGSLVTEPKNTVRRRSKLVPKILGDSNTMEIRSSPNSQKRTAAEEIESHLVKNAKRICKKIARG